MTEPESSNEEKAKSTTTKLAIVGASDGTGKNMLAANLAVMLGESGLHALLIDALDGSISRFTRQREEDEFAGYVCTRTSDCSALGRAIQFLAPKFDRVVIVAQGGALALHAMQACDTSLFPINPGGLNEDDKERLTIVRSMSPEVRFCTVITRPPDDCDLKDSAERLMEEYGLECAPVMIRNLGIFPKSYGVGCTVGEYGGRVDNGAFEQMVQLYEHLYGDYDPYSNHDKKWWRKSLTA